MSKAINAARSLAKKYKVTTPVDIVKLVKDMGITLEITPLESMSGFAYQKDGKRVIGVNESDGKLRKRFTIAHELGHMTVHVGNDVMFDKDFAYFRDAHSSTGMHIKEVEANAFAAELLMPAEKLKKQIEEAGGIDLMEDNLQIQKLADDYGVSFSAMSVRIDTLARQAHI